MADENHDDRQDQQQDRDDRQDDRSEQGDLGEKPPPEQVEQIEKERERRLDPDNRPENAVVDNTDATLPTVEEFEKLTADDDDTEGSAGTSDPSQAFRENPPSEEEVKEIEEERERRLDPDNRPENAEVDNTGDNMPDVAKD